MLVLPLDSNLFVDPKAMNALSPQRQDMLVPSALRAEMAFNNPKIIRAGNQNTSIQGGNTNSNSNTNIMASSANLSRTGSNIVANYATQLPNKVSSTQGSAPGGGSSGNAFANIAKTALVLGDSYRRNRAQHVGLTHDGDDIHAPTRGTGVLPDDVTMSRLPGMHMDEEANYQSQFPLWHA